MRRLVGFLAEGLMGVGRIGVGAFKCPAKANEQNINGLFLLLVILCGIDRLRHKVFGDELDMGVTAKLGKT